MLELLGRLGRSREFQYSPGLAGRQAVRRPRGREGYRGYKRKTPGPGVPGVLPSAWRPATGRPNQKPVFPCFSASTAPSKNATFSSRVLSSFTSSTTGAAGAGFAFATVYLLTTIFIRVKNPIVARPTRTASPAAPAPSVASPYGA